MKQPKVKFLTVIWGERYIERFCSLSLPSFLAPGNLPSLAEGTDLEVVIMTRSADVSYFSRNAAFIKLSGVCPVRFVHIDDLVTTAVYGVTLTLAYARPIIACGEDMLHTHFVFMNADFVLADGALRSLSLHIHAGRSVVLGPSYRAIAEEVEPHLEAMVDHRSSTLVLPPRQMVGMALPHPHRTTVAKMMNQSVFSSTHPNQFFWQVDKNTVLGRYFLIFMLCLKPERVMHQVNCFCDYSFIPELCPSGDEVAMGDSDEFFMLELQNRAQETFMLRQGQLPYRKIAQSLQEWTTAEHRRAASHDIVFHSDDLPPRLCEARLAAEEAVAAIHSRLGQPRSHVDHHYWVMGVEAWKEHRQRQGLSFFVPELAPYTLGLMEHYLLARYRLRLSLRRWVRSTVRAVVSNSTMRRWGRWLRRAERFVVDGPDNASTSSPHWQTTQLLNELGQELRASSKATLVISHVDGHGVLGPLPPDSRTFRETSIAETRIDDERFAHVVYMSPTLNASTQADELARLLNYVAAGGTLHVVFHLSPQHGDHVYAAGALFSLGELAGNHLQVLSIKTVGGRALAMADGLARFVRRCTLRFSHRRRTAASILLLPIALVSSRMTQIANMLIFSGFGPRLTDHSFCAVASVTLSGVWSRRNYIPKINRDEARAGICQN